MESKKYHCIRCNYEANIPLDVLREISFGKFDKTKLPVVVCPYCGAFLISDEGHEHFHKR